MSGNSHHRNSINLLRILAGHVIPCRYGRITTMQLLFEQMDDTILKKSYAQDSKSLDDLESDMRTALQGNPGRNKELHSGATNSSN